MRTSRAATAPPKLHSLTSRPTKYPNSNWAAWGYSRSPSYEDSEDGQEEEQGNSLLDRLEGEIDRHLSLSRRGKAVAEEKRVVKVQGEDQGAFKVEDRDEDEMAKHVKRGKRKSKRLSDAAKMTVMNEDANEEFPRSRGERIREREAEAARLADAQSDQSQGGRVARGAAQRPPKQRKNTKGDSKRRGNPARSAAMLDNLEASPKKINAQKKRTERREREEEAARLAAGNASTQPSGSASALAIQSGNGQVASQDMNATQEALKKKTQAEKKREKRERAERRERDRQEAARLADGQVSVLVIDHATHVGDGQGTGQNVDARHYAVEGEKSNSEKGRERQELAALALALQSATVVGSSNLAQPALSLPNEQIGRYGQIQGVENPITLEQRADDQRILEADAKPNLNSKIEEGHSIRLPSDPMEVDAVNGVPLKLINTAAMFEVPSLSQSSSKRKRADSNVKSSHPRISETEPAEVEIVSERPAKRHKKHKKHHQSQEGIIVEDEEDNLGDHRTLVNKAKERHGKTVSGKRRRREEQQSQQSSQAIAVSDHEDDASSQGDNGDFLPWDERILHQTQNSTQSTQGSSVRLHDLPQYVGKEEALIRTITHPLPPSTPSKIVPSSQRSQAPSPASLHTNSDDSDNAGTGHEPAKSVPRPVRESPIKPPLTFAARQRSASMSSSPVNASSQALQRQRNVSSSPIKVNKGKEKEKVVQKHAELAVGLESVVTDMRKVVSNIGALFSTLPVQSSPMALANTAKSNGESSQKEKKSQGDDAQKTSLLGNWESKGGRIQAYVAGEEEGTEVKENIAFSSSYVKKRGLVSISNTTVSTVNIEVGEQVVLSTDEDDEDEWKLKVCSVTEGRVRVDLGGVEEIEGTVFEIGKGGMWRIRVGERCEVRALGEDEEGENDGASIFIVGVE